jgi:hypothetical protein
MAFQRRKTGGNWPERHIPVSSPRNESSFLAVESQFGLSCVAVMNNPDQDTVIRAIEDARRILGEHIAPGRPRDATHTVERLLSVLDRNDVVHALDRIKRRRVIRLVE